MQVVVHGHGVEITAELREQVVRRTLAVLGRFGGRIGRVTVRLHATYSGAGELAICHILVDLHPGGGLGVGDAALSHGAAVERALGRAGGAVSAQLTRRRRLREQGSLAYAFFE